MRKTILYYFWFLKDLKKEKCKETYLVHSISNRLNLLIKTMSSPPSKNNSMNSKISNMISSDWTIKLLVSSPNTPCCLTKKKEPKTNIKSNSKSIKKMSVISEEMLTIWNSKFTELVSKSTKSPDKMQLSKEWLRTDKQKSLNLWLQTDKLKKTTNYNKNRTLLCPLL